MINMIFYINHFKDIFLFVLFIYIYVYMYIELKDSTLNIVNFVFFVIPN